MLNPRGRDSTGEGMKKRKFREKRGKLRESRQFSTLLTSSQGTRCGGSRTPSRLELFPLVRTALPICVQRLSSLGGEGKERSPVSE